MVSSRRKPGLSRKVVAAYLFFCLAAVCWLTAALVLTSHALLCDRTANSCLSRLGKAAAAVEITCLRQDTADLGKLVADFRRQCDAAYWAVVGLDGKFLAHTNPALEGRPAEEPAGSRSRWGDATSVRY